MAFLTILVVLLSLSAWAAADTCGTSGRSCIDRATCNETTSTCHCKHPYTWGDGFFQCYTSHQIAAEAKNDVHITTFNSETVDFPFPCRYLLTHATKMVHKRPDGIRYGYCEVMVHAYSKRFRGKIVTYGYDLAVQIWIPAYNPNYEDDDFVDQSIRIYGTTENMTKNITIMEKYGEFNPNGPWDVSEGDDLDFEDAITKMTYMEDDYKSVFNLEGCGVVVTFIPYDTELRRNQKHVPGLSVSFDKRHDPTFGSNNKVIGLAPTWKGGSHLSGILYGNLSASQSLVRRAMIGNHIQNQPDQDGDSCEQADMAMDNCDNHELTESYKSCYWMLEEPRFIRCLSDHGLDHFSFFQRCVESHCLGDADACSDLVSDVSTHCKRKDFPATGTSKVRDFLDGKLCP